MNERRSGRPATDGYIDKPAGEVPGAELSPDGSRALQAELSDISGSEKIGAASITAGGIHNIANYRISGIAPLQGNALTDEEYADMRRKLDQMDSTD